MQPIPRVPRPLYIIMRFAFDLLAVLSRLLNATVFGGSTSQTLSSRAHIESLTSETWARRRLFINRLFPWQSDHCAEQWAYDVDQAHKIIARNSVGPGL